MGRPDAWHLNGRGLFFLSLPGPAGKSQMMAVAFTPGSPPVIGRPTELFSFDDRDLRLECTAVRCFDVAADGQRFYAAQYVTPAPPPPVTHINLLLNWLEELKQKVPVR